MNGSIEANSVVTKVGEAQQITSNNQNINYDSSLIPLNTSLSSSPNGLTIEDGGINGQKLTIINISDKLMYLNLNSWQTSYPLAQGTAGDFIWYNNTWYRNP